MNKILRASIAFLLVIVLIGAVGCSLVSVNEEKDGAQIVAQIGDVKITKAEFMNQFNYMVQMYQSFGMDVTANAEDYEAFKTDMLDSLISPEVQYYHAVLEGFNALTEEQKKELATQIDEVDLEIYNAAKEQAELKVAEDPDLKLEEELIAAYKSIAEQYIGEALSQQDTRKWLEDYFIKNYSVENLRNSIYEKITVTDEEVKAAFDEQLALDKTSAADTPSQYKSSQESYERAEETGLAPLVIPAGYRRVKHIKIAPESEISSEYTTKKNEMDILEKEMGALTLASDTANNARLDEIRAEYNALKTETDKMMDDRLAQSKTKIDEAYAKLQSGTSFDTVMAEYTTDNDFKDYVVFKTKGKLMYKDTEVADWPEEQKKAVMALSEKGSYTGVIEDEEGYHILQYVGDETPGERKFSEFEEYFREDTLSSKQEEEWNNLNEAWMQDTNLIKRFPEVLKNI